MRLFSLRRISFGGGFLLGIAIAFIQVQVAQAYIVNKRWGTNTGDYAFYLTFPNEWRSLASYGAGAWTNVSTSSWTWQLFTPESLSPSKLYRGALDGPGGSALAIVGNWKYCNGNNICGYTMTLDEAENWYAGTGTPASNQVDVQSIVIHEFGHAAALGHYEQGPTVTGVNCNGTNTARPTICGSYVYGSTWWRSLEADDRNGISSAYPQ